MIRLSTKGRYGTRLMLNLAKHYNNGVGSVVLKDLSKEEDISIRYLEQIIIPLKLNNLVKSIRGAGGGYKLARHPSEINLVDILKALEGPCCLVECVDDDEYCDRISTCAAHEIWEEASAMLKNYFEDITLEKLVKISNKKETGMKTK